MTDEFPAQILNAYLTDEETEDETLAGKLQFGGDGRLSLIECLPDQETFLTNVIEAMNAKEELVEKAPPPDDAPRFALSSKVVKRTDPDFFPALQRYLSTYYGINLG
jgi:hypothetical protein